MQDKLVGQRVWVIGGPGSGKTFFSKRLSSLLESPYFELDSLVWGRGWQKASEKEILERVERVSGKEKWIIDGRYDAVTQLLAEQCDTVVYIDFPLIVRFFRVFKRSVHSVVTGKELWNGNKEDWRRLFSSDSMLLYMLRINKREHSKENALLSDLQGKSVFRLKTKKEIERFLKKTEEMK